MRPAEDESVLQDLSSQPETALREEFVKQLDGFRNMLLKGVSPKKAGGNAVNGAGLVVLLQSYVDAINTTGIPKLKDAWSAAMSAQLNSFANTATRELKASINKIQEERLPMDASSLKSCLEKMKMEALKSIPGENTNATRKSLVEKLSVLADNLIEDTIRENVNRSNLECEEKFDRLWNEQNENKEEEKNEDDVILNVWRKYDRVRTKYFETCDGPSLISTFSSRTWMFNLRHVLEKKKATLEHTHTHTGTDRYLKPALESIVQNAKIEKEDMLGRIEELNRNIEKRQEELKFASQELGRARSHLAEVESEKKEVEANLEVVNESLSKRNEELLTSNLELDKQRALVKSHVEKMENLTRELDEKSREATKWKQQEEQKRKELERSQENLQSKQRQMASIRGKLDVLRKECQSIRSKQGDVVSWTKSQIRAEQGMLEDSLKRFVSMTQRLQSRVKSDAEFKRKDEESRKLLLERQVKSLEVAEYVTSSRICSLTI